MLDAREKLTLIGWTWKANILLPFFLCGLFRWHQTKTFSSSFPSSLLSFELMFIQNIKWQVQIRSWAFQVEGGGHQDTENSWLKHYKFGLTSKRRMKKNKISSSDIQFSWLGVWIFRSYRLEKYEYSFWLRRRVSTCRLQYYKKMWVYKQNRVKKIRSSFQFSWLNLQIFRRFSIS